MNDIGKLKILLLCSETARHTGTVDGHILAFKHLSRHDVFELDSSIASTLKIDLSMFDAVVFHYSMVISMPAAYLPNGFVDRLANFKGPKMLFIQDEFRWVDHTMAAVERLCISVVFTVVNEDAIRKIYRNPYFDNVRFEQTLTGFVPEHLIGREVPAYQDRTIDVSYRARKLPGWCGSFALQKWHIGERFMKDAPCYGLNCDIAMSEASRIYGEHWIEFMAGSKAMLGTESGASFVDYTGQVYKEIDTYEAANPEATFEEVREKFLEGRDGDVVINVISPRCFEAACLKTLMIMYPGEYSGVLQAGRHYLMLAPDHSNMDEVVAVLRNPERAGEIIHNTYEEVVKSDAWTHKMFISHFDRIIDEVALQPVAQSMSADLVDRKIANAQEEAAKIANAQEEAAKIAEREALEAERAVHPHRIQRKMGLVMLGQRMRVAISNLAADLTMHYPQSMGRTRTRYPQAMGRTRTRYRQAMGRTRTRYRQAMGRTRTRYRQAMGRTRTRYRQAMGRTRTRYRQAMGRTRTRYRQAMGRTRPRYRQAMGRTRTRYRQTRAMALGSFRRAVMSSKVSVFHFFSDRPPGGQGHLGSLSFDQTGGREEETER